MNTDTTMSITCFFCGETGYLSEKNDEIFSASMLKVNGKVGCICMNCLKKLYNNNKQHFNDSISSGPNLSMVKTDDTKPSVIKGESKRGDELFTLLKKWHCLDFSLESYIKLAESKVIGQSNAVKRTMFALYTNQYLNLIEDFGLNTPQRKQIFMIGPTGVGKTHTAIVAAKLMQIPYARSNAESITAAGYIGDKVEAILERLLDNANGDIVAAQEGIVIIDEIDKKAKRTSNSERDINGLSVQQELLKIIEPSEVYIKQHTIKFDTSHLTVILCGAFVGLEDIIQERICPKHIGFSNSEEETKNFLSKVENVDFEKYGFIPEFLGRAPYPIVLEKLSYDSIMEIINEKLNEEYVLFQVRGVELYVNPFAKAKIANRVLNQETGARDIKKELDELLYPAEFLILSITSTGICEIDEYGKTTFVYTDDKTGKTLVKEIPSTLNYMLEEIYDDDDDDDETYTNILQAKFE